MSSILYYITGHGYGHAVRSHQVIRALATAKPTLRIHVRTTAPAWLFANCPTPVIHSRQSIDAGVIQRDSLEMDLARTLQACREIHDHQSEIIERELDFIKTHQVELVVGDTPPLAFEIAARASIPSVSITNFTWDVIYRAYRDEYPGFSPLIDEMSGYYRHATLALTLPYPCDTSLFLRRQAIPWIARHSSLSKQTARAQFGLPQSATIVLLSFGGLGLERLPWEQLKLQRDFCFVTTGDGPRSDGNVVILQDSQSRYEDLVRAMDAIVTKPGYGIVADVLAHQLPLLYTDRGEFPEYANLVEALRDCAVSEFIPQSDLLRGSLTPYLTRLLTRTPNWPAIELNGAEVAAAKILELLPARSSHG